MIAHDLTLHYALAPGWMAPFVDGLLQGRAMARHCGACGAASFPPRRTCACGHGEGNWVALPGTASILFRTQGRDGDFALARFDGADGSAVTRLQDMPPDRGRGRIRAAPGPLPQLILGPAGPQE